MPRRSGPGNISVLFILAAMSLLFFLSQASAESIWKKDIQGLRAEIVREMVEKGNYLIPHLNGEPYLTKPPLYYWLAAFSARLSGLSELALRLPSIIAAFLGAFFTYLLGKRLLGHRAGLFSAVILTSSPIYFFYARSINLDPLLACLVTAAIYLLASAATAEARGKAYFISGCFVLGLSMMTKGPVGMIFVIPPVLWLFWTNRHRKPVDGRALFFGAAAFMAVILPWSLIVLIKVPGIWQTLLEESLYRYTPDKYAAVTRPFYFYLPVVLGTFAPWSFFFPPSLPYIRETFRERLRGRTTAVFLLAWTVPALIIFSLTSNKRPWYLLPLAPALALFVGWLWDRRFSAEVSIMEKRLFQGALWLAGLLFLMLGTALPAALLRIHPARPFFAVGCGLSLVLAAILGMIVRRQPLSSFFTLVLMVALAWGIWLGGFLPQIDAYRTRKPFFREASRMSEGHRLYAYRYQGYDLQFYTSREVPILASEEDLKRVTSGYEKAYVIAEDKHQEEIQEMGYRPSLSRSWRDPFREGRVREMYLFSR